jgi:Domain of unknown function (DUF4034)
LHMSRTAAASSLFRHLRKSRRAAYFGLLLPLFFSASVKAQTQTPAVVPTSRVACAVSEPGIEGPTDVQDLKEYSSTIANLLVQERFDDLDCIAHQARISKTRLPGGTWKLVAIYNALEAPIGHATEQDWKEHLIPLEHWVAAKPDSITARVALANTYVSYAWDARGSGYSDTVTINGWDLFNQRLQKATDILGEASSLQEKCPEWYLIMQHIAQGQGWDLEQENALFQKAIAFEPEYYSYYRVQAVLLLPKWFGEAGDAAAFASKVADQIGGKKGDILYFQIAAKLACSCDDPQLKGMSWERIQKGFAATEEAFGTSIINLNSFALIAVNFQDYYVADAAFKRIGENWDKDVWTTEAWFNQNRDNAAQMGPVQARNRQAQQEGEANMKTTEGQAYRKEVERKMATFEQTCVDQTKGNMGTFEINLKIGEHGSAEDARGKQAPDNFGLCLLKALYVTYANKQTPFPPPPRASYWVPLVLDPSTFAASAK